jgi:hypothetical protein
MDKAVRWDILGRQVWSKMLLMLIASRYIEPARGVTLSHGADDCIAAAYHRCEQ